MEIQNKGLANTKLVIGGKAVTGDADGTFELSEDQAKGLLATPGWHLPVEEPTPQAAPQEAATAPEPAEAAQDPQEDATVPTEVPGAEEEAPSEEAPTTKPKKKRKPRSG